MNKNDVVNALIKRVDVADAYSHIHSFDVEVLEQTPELSDLLNDLVNAVDSDRIWEITFKLKESLGQGVYNVADDIMDSYEGSEVDEKVLLNSRG